MDPRHAGVGMELVLRLVVLGPYLLMFVSLALNAWRMYVMYRDAPQTRPRDVSAEHRPVLVKRTPWAEELERLGFQRLGEVELILPAIGLVAALIRRTQRHTAWIFVDAQQTTEAVLAERLVGFSSRLRDGSYVETIYPRSDPINDQDLVITRVTSGVTDAYHRHRAVVAARISEHGAPRPIATMAEQAVHDSDYRIKHARRQLFRPLIIRGLVPLAAAAIFIAAVGWMTSSAIDALVRVLAR